ncbi:MAG: hypothetical protein ACK4KU_03980 [Acinetobacter sp.]|uniref:hypothetical protein n=1 Tax=Acinetobacter sp. TaxID=472 RepID=UPI00391DBE18
MEAILKIVTVLGSILVPLLVAHLSSRNSIRRHPKEEFADDVKNAKEFEALIGSKEPNLIKDRVAQQLFQSKKITFREAIYFRQFENMECWVKSYISVKRFIKVDRDDENNIIDISFEYSLRKRARYLLVYGVTVSLGLFLIFWFNPIRKYLNINFDWPNPLTITIIVLWSFVFLSLGFYNLVTDKTYSEAKKFMTDFRDEAIKLK